MASAWTQGSATRDWIQSWIHRTALGGLKKGRSVAHAIDELLEDFESGAKILLSLDYKKCFDNVDPALGLYCLQHFG